MKKRNMTDYQRCQAGKWIEDNRPWIDMDPSFAMIARQATKELGHRVTDHFVSSYLTECGWYQRAEAKGSSDEIQRVHQDIQQIRDTILILNRALCKIGRAAGYTDDGMYQLLNGISEDVRPEPKSPVVADNLHELMAGGHA